jgi:hypothetical protein
MANYLLYWKFFWDDIAENPNDFNDNWHTEQEGFWYKANEGDNLWVVVSGGLHFPDEWRLLHKIVVQEKFYNPSDGRRFEIKGNPISSQRFEVSVQSDLTHLLQTLEFESGKKIRVNGKAIGNALQAIRPLTENDGLLLEEYAENLERHSTDSGFIASLLEQSNEDLPSVKTQTGAGFGNPETNRKVERAAIKVVTEWYQSEGWSVKSVEAEKCGYDLLCQKESEENHVEVKGVQGEIISFIITVGEVKRAQNDSDFVLCVVTSALTDSPNLTLFEGESFNSDFELSPLSYRATLRKLN